MNAEHFGTFAIFLGFAIVFGIVFLGSGIWREDYVDPGSAPWYPPPDDPLPPAGE